MFLAAGCGGEEHETPRLPAPLAESLAARSDAVADQLDTGDACAARAEADALQAAAIAAVNEGLVPAPLQEELLSSVTALAGSIACEPAPAAPAAEEEDDDEGGGKSEGKGKKKGKGKRK